MRVPIISSKLPTGFRQRAAFLTAPVPPTTLLLPTRLLTHKFIRLFQHSKALYSSCRWPTPALLLNLGQTRRAIPSMASLSTLMNTTRKQLGTNLRTSRYWIQATLTLLRQWRLPTMASIDLLRQQLAVTTRPRMATFTAIMILTSKHLPTH